MTRAALIVMRKRKRVGVHLNIRIDVCTQTRVF